MSHLFSSVSFMFNARSESVHEKASFRRLLPKCRCLAIAEGFYEWKKDGTQKQPYYIHFKDGRPLVFAGLYDCWTNSEGEVLYTFTILTTRSSKVLEWLHDRMPVILGSKKAIDEWLNPDNSLPSLQSLMQPYDLEDLVWYAVNTAIGKVSFDGPECIKQVKLVTETKNAISKLFQKQRCTDQHDDASVESENSAHKFVSKISDEPPLNGQKLPHGSFLHGDTKIKAFLGSAHPDEDPLLCKAGNDVEKVFKMKEDHQSIKNDSISNGKEKKGDLTGEKGIKREDSPHECIKVENDPNVGKGLKFPKKEDITDGKGIKREHSPDQCIHGENSSNSGKSIKSPKKKYTTDENGMKLECSLTDGKNSSLGWDARGIKSLNKEEINDDGKGMKIKHSPDEKSKRTSMAAGEKQMSLLNFFGKH